jgi:hypothetical protein
VAKDMELFNGDAKLFHRAQADMGLDHAPEGIKMLLGVRGRAGPTRPA